MLKPIGAALLPGFKTVLQPIGELSEKLAGFLERHKSFTLVIGSVAAGLFTVAFATTAVRYAWLTVKAPWLMGIELLSKIRLGSEAAAAAELGLAEATEVEAAASATAGAARIGLVGRLASMLGLAAGAETAAAGGIHGGRRRVRDTWCGTMACRRRRRASGYCGSGYLQILDSDIEFLPGSG